MGWYKVATNLVGFNTNTNTVAMGLGGAGPTIPRDQYLGWCASASTADPCTSGDTTVARPAAKNLQIGVGGDSSGSFFAASFQSHGTTFTTNNGCTDAATAGGATAGTFTVGAVTSCTEVVTMGNSATAPNGWSCTALDLTTSADVTNPHQTATSTTTATIVTGTIVASDKIQFSCVGY